MATIEEIKSRLCNGDYATIGQMVGVSRKYARILIDRSTASKHVEVVEAATKLLGFKSTTRKSSRK